MGNVSPLQPFVDPYVLPTPPSLRSCTNERVKAVACLVFFTLIGVALGEAGVHHIHSSNSVERGFQIVFLRFSAIFLGLIGGFTGARFILHDYEDEDVKRRTRKNILTSRFVQLAASPYTPLVFIQKNIITPQEIQNLFIRDVRRPLQNSESLSFETWFNVCVDAHHKIFHSSINYAECPIFLRIKSVTERTWAAYTAHGRLSLATNAVLVPLKVEFNTIIHELIGHEPAGA